MRKLITLAVLIGSVGVTWAGVTALTSPGTPEHQGHQMHAMGSGHGRMHGMMGGDDAAKSPHHSQAGMHGHSMRACDMASHGTGKHDHQKVKPDQ